MNRPISDVMYMGEYKDGDPIYFSQYLEAQGIYKTLDYNILRIVRNSRCEQIDEESDEESDEEKAYKVTSQ